MLLKNILHSEKEVLNQIKDSKFLDLEISEIVNDSRSANGENILFFAVKGFKIDASKFVPTVIKQGIKAIICEDTCDLKTNAKDYLNDSKVLILTTSEPKKLLGRMLSRLYPHKPKYIMGVTGTNGKTTVAELTRQALVQLGYNAGSIGSLGVKYVVNGKEEHIEYHHSLTNPDLIEFHKYLALMKEKGVDYVITEATSQGIRNGRLEGIEMHAGAFTNITREHMGDNPTLHKDFQDYFYWKMKLFTELVKKNGYAIINANVPEYSKMKEIISSETHQEILDYGHNGEKIKIKNIIPNDRGQSIKLLLNEKDEIELSIPFIGEFSVSNICCIIGFLISLGLKNKIKDIDFMKLVAAKGRAELMGMLPNGAKVYMDYPHTADGLKNSIITFKKYQESTGSNGRVIILFGAGGDRDPLKRPIMGKLATDYADLAIVTEDSPRTENHAKIREEIMAGCDKSKAVNIGNDKPGETIEGRIRAVEYAMSILQENDILITNKGHERIIEANGIYHHYDEEQLLKSIIIEMGGKVF